MDQYSPYLPVGGVAPLKGRGRCYGRNQRVPVGVAIAVGVASAVAAMTLLPGRFLAMAAHLALLLRMGGDPPKSPSGELEPGFWGALGGSLALLGVEFLGFFSGVSMFHSGQSLGSLGAHIGAALGLTLGWIEAWDGPALWATLALSVPSAVTELLLLGRVLLCHRGAL
ncbi:transmembrane protein 107 [Agelaius tricolor]|uniref:transmembrane protein 107 n=1 Tax=Agelaius tricolor TaxID=9191 RepID=UPI0039F1EBE1